MKQNLCNKKKLCWKYVTFCRLLFLFIKLLCQSPMQVFKNNNFNFFVSNNILGFKHFFKRLAISKFLKFKNILATNYFLYCLLYSNLIERFFIDYDRWTINKTNILEPHENGWIKVPCELLNSLLFIKIFATYIFYFL